MIELDAAQVAQLQAFEQDDFVRRVHADLVQKFAELAGKPALEEQLREANRHALELGIADSGLRTQFLHQAAWAPRFYLAPAVNSWLTKPGATAEQRWKDFMALLGHKLGLEKKTEGETD